MRGTTRPLRDELRAFVDMLLDAEPNNPALCGLVAERNRRLLAERGPERVCRPGRLM